MQKFLNTTPRQLAGLLIILIAGAAWIGVSAARPGETTGGGIPAPHTGFLAPDFTLLNQDGEAVVLSDLRGRPVLINLWASWCGPCRAEMPAIERVYNAYKDGGFVVLAVNATNQDSTGAALEFANRLGLSFPILFDVTGSVSDAYQLRALPSTFFVSADGKVQEVVIGGPMAEALLRTRVERLLEGTE